MPLTEVDPNVRHNSLSKVSNFSGKTSHKEGQGIPPSNNGASNPAGVFSMLKTTTEIGDIGTFVNQSKIPRRPGPPRRPSNLASSGASSHYSRAGSIRSQASSTRSKRSNGDRSVPGAWPYRQYPQPSSVDALLPDSQSFTGQHRANSIASTTDRFDLEPRSYSLTHASRTPGARGLSNHPSLVSLRNGSNLSSRPRSPYNNSSRLRRPAHRPGSPALSDTMATVPYSRSNMVRPPVGARALTASPVQHRDPRIYLQSRDPAYYEPPVRPYNHGGFRPMQQSPMVRPYPDYAQDFYPGTHNLSASEAAGESSGYPARPPPPFRPSPSPLSNDSSSIGPKPTVRPPAPYDGPHVGFVRRVKQALEEKASLEDFSRRPSPPLVKKSIERSDRPFGHESTGLPASPEVKRLTRDMIKAAVGPPSDTGAMSPDDAAGSVVSVTHADSSSAEDSSIHARSSEDVPASCSTPELQNSGSSVAHTVPSSVEGNVRAEDGGDVLSPQPITKPVDGVIPTTSSTITKLQITPESALEVSQPDHNGYPETATSSQAIRTPYDVLKRPVTMPSISPTRQVPAQVDRQSLPEPATLQHREIPQIIAEARPDDHRARESVQISRSDMGDDEDSTTNHDISAPPSARNSFHTVSRPESISDPLTWASSSILACRSYNADYSRRTSASTVLDAQQQGPRRSLVVPTVPSTNAVYVHEYPVRQSMASVELPSLFQPTTAPEPRTSGMKQFHFPMPDLTEDSQEDASTTNLRMLGSRAPNFRSGPYKKARREPRAPTRAEPTPQPAKPPASYLSTKLADTKSMPSLNFSHNDLTTKLNLALGLSSHRSLEELKQLTAYDHENDTPELKLTKADLRERYKSFFSQAEESEEITEPTSTSNEDKTAKPNAFVDELDQLSIPSVQGLTVRLSEILPSIKKGDYSLDLTKSDQALGDTVDQIRDVGSLERMTSLECKRASLMSALSAGAFAQSRRSGGTTGRNRTQRENGNVDTNKDLPMLPTEGKDPRPSTATASAKQRQDAKDDTIIPTEATVPMEPPSSENPASTGQTSKSQINGKHKVYSRREIDDALRQHADSEPSSDEDPTVQVPVPNLREADKLSDSRPVSRLRRSRSIMDTPADQIEHVVRSMSPGPQMQTDLIPASEEPDNQDRDQRGSKGIIGSIQRKIGARKRRSDREDWHLDPIFLHPEERAVTGPGDRYPTTSLSPPSHGHVDDGRSYFSDDSSLNEEARTSVFRKRLTRLKNRHSQQQ